MLTEEQQIRDYRENPDPGDKKRNAIITKHLALVKKISARFISSKYSRDDITEFAYFELVQAVIRAKTSLKDNKIRPYIITCVRLKLIEYVSTNHIITLPPHSHYKTWGKTSRNSRVVAERALANEFSAEDHVMLDEILDKAITSQSQLQVVNLRLASYKFREIADETGYDIKVCQRLWYEYQATVKEYYGEILPNVSKNNGKARRKNLQEV